MTCFITIMVSTLFATPALADEPISVEDASHETCETSETDDIALDAFTLPDATAKAIWPKSWAEKFCATMHLPGTEKYSNCVKSLSGAEV